MQALATFESRVRQSLAPAGFRLLVLVGWLCLGSLTGRAASSPLVFDWFLKNGVYPGRADQFKASTTDAAGNTYLVGTTASTGAFLNILTVKVNPNGQVVWLAEYDGVAHKDDIPRSIEVDSQGDVYVTGSSINSRGDTDLVLLRYTSSGQPSGNWAAVTVTGERVGERKFDGQQQSYDEGIALKVDANGFVYVTGSSVGNGTFTDIILMKFNQLGELLWRVTYDGPDHFVDLPVFLQLTPQGYILVGGESAGVGTEADWVLLLYDGVGNPAESVWTDTGFGYGVRRYNYADASYDVPTAAVFDASGNLYVAGNVLPTDGTTDMALIRINQDGSQAWAVRHDGPAGGSDQTAGLVIDSNGELVLAGTSEGVGTGKDVVLLRYANNGTPSSLWADSGFGVGVRRYASSGLVEDAATSLKIDSQGNLYVGGFVFDAVAQYDFQIPVFSRRGVLWGVGRYDGGTSESERILGIHLDNNSRLVAVGTHFGSEGDDQLLTVRFGVKPLFDVVPTYRTLYAGGGATFSVSPPAGSFSYQWNRNGGAISLAQASAYTLSAATLGLGGDYSVTVQNAYGSTDFLVAEVTVVTAGWNSSSGTTLSLAGKSGAQFQIDQVNSLDGTIVWSSPSPLTLGAGTSTVTDAAASVLGQRFYRIRRVTP